MISFAAFIVAFCGFIISITDCLDGPCPNIGHTPLPAGISLAGYWKLEARNLDLEPNRPIKCLNVDIRYLGQRRYNVDYNGTYTSGGQFHIRSELTEVDGQNYNYVFDHQGDIHHTYVFSLTPDHYCGADISYNETTDKCLISLEFAAKCDIRIDEELENCKNSSREKGIPDEIADAMAKFNEDCSV